MEKFRIGDNYRFTHAGKEFLFVIHNAAVTEIDPSIDGVLQDLRGKREIGGAELEAILRRRVPTDELADVMRGLVEYEILNPVNNGHFVPVDVLEKRTKTPPPLTSLTAHVTQDCNLRCTYCYADHGLYGAADKRLMKPEQVHRYIDLLMLESGDAREVTFTFFGGEPLMNFGAIEEGVRYGKRRAAELGKHIQFSMTTNGTLFDRKKVDFCVEHGIQVTVSVDGGRAANDGQRPFVGGRGSYDATIEKCRPLLERQRVAARVTVTSQNLEVHEIIDHLLSVGFAEAGVTPVATLNAHLDLGDDEMAIFAAEMERTCDRFVENALRGRYYGFSNAVSLMKQFHEGAARGHPCGAGAGLLAGNVSGELYACHRNMNDKNYLLGHLDRGGIFHDDRREFLDEVHVSNKPLCHECWLRSLCAGGCYYLGSLYEGDKSAVYEFHCDWIRRWYLYVLKAYLTIQDANPAFVDRVVGGGAAA